MPGGVEYFVKVHAGSNHGSSCRAVADTIALCIRFTNEEGHASPQQRDR